MLADLNYIFLWWLVLFLISLVSWPLTFSLFSKFYDRGYIFTKTISLIVLSFLALVLGIFHILPFTKFSLITIILVLICINISYLLTKKRWTLFIKTIKQKFLLFIFQEFIFLSILIIWSFVRGYAPDIEGLEKFMDWGFVNSILKSTYFPPVDMWFSGSPINYYYFGHLIIALVTKLSGINSAITYNLAIASTCALTFVSAFSFTSNLIFNSNRKLSIKYLFIGGLFSAMLVTFGGNIHPLYKITKNIIQNEGALTLTKTAIEKAANTYWYPDATRFIGFDPDIQDKTIHEFPIYSFVVADLHGHMNGIPIIILLMSYLLAFYLSHSLKKGINFQLVIPLGFLLSVAFMTNAWDFAVYGLLFALSFLIISKFSFFSTIVNGISVIFFWFIFTLPFSLRFIPMAEGLRLSDSHTPFYQLFILYGGFWLITLPFFIFFIKKFLSKKTLLITDFFVLAMILTATILIIIPELIYIKDIYIFEHRRANTMFKLVYQAFIIYSLVAGYCLIRLRASAIYKLIFSVVIIVHLIYPFYAIKSYYGLKDYRGLYGLNFLKTLYPDNYAAINWINQNIKYQPVMLEAVGDSYTTYNQISMSTGLPTVEGWVVHEWLWRGGYDKPAARATDVQKIYESIDLTEVQSLLTKYQVDYIFVGDKEYEKYPQMNVLKFNNFGKIVFESGKTRIYQIN